VSLSPESIKVGQCYLTEGHLRRVVAVLPDRRVQYEWRGGVRTKWKPGILTVREFALAAERPMTGRPKQTSRGTMALMPKGPYRTHVLGSHRIAMRLVHVRNSQFLHSVIVSSSADIGWPL
jgi:hypothetical protein